jgi:hypothetical protein
MSIFIPSVDGVVSGQKSYVWSIAELAWVPLLQPGGSEGGGGDASAANQATEIARLQSILTQLQGGIDVNSFALSWVAQSLTVFDGAPAAILTPLSGKKLRVYYASYSPTSAPTLLYFSFGSGGAPFLRNNIVVAGSIIAKDFGSHRYVEGGVNVPLYVTTNADVDVHYNVFYTEV